MTGYEGPDEVHWIAIPKRGTSYNFKIAGRAMQVTVSSKGKNFRVHVDGVEWEAKEMK